MSQMKVALMSIQNDVIPTYDEIECIKIMMKHRFVPVNGLDLDINDLTYKVELRSLYFVIKSHEEITMSVLIPPTLYWHVLVNHGDYVIVSMLGCTLSFTTGRIKIENRMSREQHMNMIQAIINLPENLFAIASLVDRNSKIEKIIVDQCLWNINHHLLGGSNDDNLESVKNDLNILRVNSLISTKIIEDTSRSFCFIMTNILHFQLVPLSAIPKDMHIGLEKLMIEENNNLASIMANDASSSSTSTSISSKKKKSRRCKKNKKNTKSKAEVSNKKTIELVNPCSICFTEEKKAVLIPCGHTFCKDCAAKVKPCPECRSEVERVNVLFI